MMKLKMFQVDAFAERLFTGNPAAVVVLDAPIGEEVMQAIAAENNLAETAFVMPQDGAFALRWFTPVHEAAFCGHATLATAHVLASAYAIGGEMTFLTRRVGALKVRPEGASRYTLDLPRFDAEPVHAAPDAWRALFPQGWSAVLRNFENIFVVLPDETAVRQYRPDDKSIAMLDPMGLCITAAADAGSGIDFVSRYFAPAAGIPEDPVTGSTHASLVPYWAGRLGRKDLRAYQASRRGGHLHGQLDGDRVLLTGHAVTFMEATIDSAA